MVRIAFDVPEGVLGALHRDREAFIRELRVAAAVKWYESEQISQGRAAEIAGLSRAEFIDALGRYNVSPFQVTAVLSLARPLQGRSHRHRPRRPRLHAGKGQA